MQYWNRYAIFLALGRQSMVPPTRPLPTASCADCIYGDVSLTGILQSLSSYLADALQLTVNLCCWNSELGCYVTSKLYITVIEARLADLKDLLSDHLKKACSSYSLRALAFRWLLICFTRLTIRVEEHPIFWLIICSYNPWYPQASTTYCADLIHGDVSLSTFRVWAPNYQIHLGTNDSKTIHIQRWIFIKSSRCSEVTT